MIRKITLLFVLSLLLADPAASNHLRGGRIPPFEVLVHCVDYLNAGVQDLHRRQAALEALQTDFDAYRHAFPATREGRLEMEARSQGLHYAGRRLGQQVKATQNPVLVKHQRVTESLVYLPLADQQRLAQSLELVHALYLKLNTLESDLAAYVNTGLYRDDPTLERGYRLLKEQALLFEDFALLSQRLHYDLTQTPGLLSTKAYHQPVYLAGAALEKVVDGCDELMATLRTGAVGAVRKQQGSLSAQLAALSRHEETWLNAEPAAARHYQAVLTQAGALLQVVKEYLDAPELPAGQGYSDKHRYYFNQRLLPLYTAPETGLVARYNQYVAASGAQLLPLSYVPGRMEVILPEAAPPQLATATEGPRNLVFLVDVSGSMHSPEKLPLLRAALSRLLPALHAADHVSLVTFSGTAQVLLSATPASEQDLIRSRLQELGTGGESNPIAGFELAYAEARRHLQPGSTNRLVVVTDAGFKVPQALPALLEREGYAEIQPSFFYVGQDPSHAAPRLQHLAGIGQGTYHHLHNSNAHQWLSMLLAIPGPQAAQTQPEAPAMSRVR